MSAQMGFGDSKADQAMSMSEFNGMSMKSTPAFKSFGGSLPSKTQAPEQKSSFGFALGSIKSQIGRSSVMMSASKQPSDF
jgi:hypothetical protein